MRKGALTRRMLAAVVGLAALGPRRRALANMGREKRWIIHFDVNSAQISSEGRSIVAELVTYARASGDVVGMTIDGRADADEHAPRYLARRRAEAVTNAIAAAGFDRRRLEVLRKVKIDLPLKPTDQPNMFENREVGVEYRFRD